MAEAQAEQAQKEQEEQDPREGYERVVTGSTKHPDAADAEDGRVEAVIGVYVGDNLREAVEKYGEDFVYENYVRSVVVAAQGKVRRELDNGTPVAAVEQEFDDLDPTEKRTTIQDPQAQAMRAFQKMSEEQKEQFRKIMDQAD